MRELHSIRTHRTSQADDVFICSASFEERCLGTCRMFDGYLFGRGFIFVNDQPAGNKESHLEEIRNTAEGIGNCEVISYSESDPAASIGLFTRQLQELNLDSNSVITLDITTFNKRHLLMLLNELDQ